MSRRGRFWLTYGALLGLGIAMVWRIASGQTQLGGGGGIEPAGGQTGIGIPTNVTEQHLLSIYNFTNDPDGPETGWLVSQSTTGGVGVSAVAPYLQLVPTSFNRRARIWERGWADANTGIGLTKNEGYRVLFHVDLYNGLQGTTLGTNGLIYVCIADTTYTTVDRTPDGFGVLALGTGETFGGIQADEWVGFVGNGTDTTFLPLGETVSSDNYSHKFYIDAVSGGAVDFYVDNVLRQTISSPARSANADNRGLSLWLNTDAQLISPGPIFGPFILQREWD